MATKVVHAGYQFDPLTGAIMPPITLSTTFEQKSPGVPIGVTFSLYNKSICCRSWSTADQEIQLEKCWNKLWRPWRMENMDWLFRRDWVH